MRYIGIYPPENYPLEVAKGSKPGYSGIHKFAFSEKVGTSLETIWSGDGLYPWITSASTLTVESSSSNDISTGTGARTIYIQGLDSNYNAITETVTLNGTEQVTTSSVYYRIYRAYVLTAGSTGGAEGDISIKQEGTIVCHIDSDFDNQTLMSVYTVAAGYTAYLVCVDFSTGKGKEVFCSLNTRPVGGVFNIQHSIQLNASNANRVFMPYIKIDEKTDIELRAVNLNSGNVEVSGAFDLIIIKN